MVGLTTHSEMESTTPILPENYDYPLDDFIHRLMNGFGLEELVEKGRKKEVEARKVEEKARKAAEEKLRKVEANYLSTVKKLSEKGFDIEQIAQLLSLPVTKIRQWLA